LRALVPLRAVFTGVKACSNSSFEIQNKKLLTQLEFHSNLPLIVTFRRALKNSYNIPLIIGINWSIICDIHFLIDKDAANQTQTATEEKTFAIKCYLQTSGHHKLSS